MFLDISFQRKPKGMVMFTIGFLIRNCVFFCCKEAANTLTSRSYIADGGSCLAFSFLSLVQRPANCRAVSVFSVQCWLAELFDPGLAITMDYENVDKSVKQI